MRGAGLRTRVRFSRAHAEIGGRRSTRGGVYSRVDAAYPPSGISLTRVRRTLSLEEFGTESVGKCERFFRDECLAYCAQAGRSQPHPVHPDAAMQPVVIVMLARYTARLVTCTRPGARAGAVARLLLYRVFHARLGCASPL